MGKISECAEWAHPKIRRVIFTWNFRFGIVAQHDVTTFFAASIYREESSGSSEPTTVWRLITLLCLAFFLRFL